MNAYHGIDARISQTFAARKKRDEQQFHPDSKLAPDGFDIWWQKTFAQHTAVFAEASALVRAHRGIGSASLTGIGGAR